MAEDYYTWSQFVTKVRELVPLESQRKGVGTSADDYFIGLVRQAVIQIQGIIDEFRHNHEDIYELNDFAQEGQALRGVKPPQSAIKSAVFFKRNGPDKTYDRYEVVNYSWDRCKDLIDGIVEVNDGKARMAIDPQGYTFYIYPTPPDTDCAYSWALSIKWDGLKLAFEDGDEVPFTEQMALAVSYFIRFSVALDVEEDPAKFDRFYKLWELEKPRLYRAAKEKRAIKG